jgi:hypothetical protein
MCDYSLHAVATRPAEVAETLVSTKFHATTRGFASPTDPRVAVCLRPGTEIAFEKDALTDRMVFRKKVGARLARFRQVDMEKSQVHHDALEFSNGKIVLVTELVPRPEGCRPAIACEPHRGKASLPICGSARDCARLIDKKAPERSGAFSFERDLRVSFI